MSFRDVGLEMLDPVDVKLDIDLSVRAKVDMLVSMLRNGDVDWLWSARPCMSHSAAQNGRIWGGQNGRASDRRGIDFAFGNNGKSVMGVGGS